MVGNTSFPLGDAPVATDVLRVRYSSGMGTRIAQRELRNNNAEILNRVEAGESFTVTRNGVPVADVVPHVEHTEPPMFPRTTDLVAHRRELHVPVDWESWVRDVRDTDEWLNDDPFDIRA